ncbi:DUF1684 domain-containing protein [Gordonia sp. CPCC 205333]|uniref:DUF1684 domain-containing protein n=1 Tax=Gordonia sp. CPCC 205333 TaxID=3140790 RepID=UPI003AF3D89C
MTATTRHDISEHTDSSAFTTEWQTWHTAHEQSLAAPHGFLAVTSLNWLGSVPERFVDAPGLWSTVPDGVVVELAEHEELTIDGRVITGRYLFSGIPERGGVTAEYGAIAIEVALRGGKFVLRPRNPNHLLRSEFRGTPAFAPQPDWVIDGRFTAYPEPVSTTVGAAVEGLEHVYAAIGEVSFRRGDDDYRLIAFDGSTPGSLQILFSDATAGVSTYGLVRGLTVPSVGSDGSVTLDFNRATNLPCAYTPFATCPLPPGENRLSLEVTAGEQLPVAVHSTPGELAHEEH